MAWQWWMKQWGRVRSRRFVKPLAWISAVMIVVGVLFWLLTGGARGVIAVWGSAQDAAAVVSVPESRAPMATRGPTEPSFVRPVTTLDRRITDACAAFPLMPKSNITTERVTRATEALRSTLGMWSRMASMGTLLIEVCQFPTDRAVATLETLDETGQGTSLQDTRMNWCGRGALLVQVGSPMQWTSREYVSWYQQCAVLFAAPLVPLPAVPSSSRASSPAPVSFTQREEQDAEPDDAEVAKKVCPEFHAVAAKYASIASGAARDAELTAYGRGLAMCGPNQEPWEVFAVAEGRSGFVRTYVFPYINRADARIADATAYATVAHAWGFD